MMLQKNITDNVCYSIKAYDIIKIVLKLLIKTLKKPLNCYKINTEMIMINLEK